ncbi:MAG: hypothetical protein FWD01_01070 [Defluviitaleaceae bacterium]|nr:hypothetical protein [Defluviitaleaceae bacterium]
MTTLLHIILINLIVSFDNVGVIALASRGLEPKKANLARQLGIWLSLALKFIFIIFVRFLFGIEWLHIRLIGGIMLIYVVYDMMGALKQDEKGNKSPKSFGYVIFSIIAADISMSLDNVIALLSIVSGENDEIGIYGLVLVCIGLAVSVPILLWFSETFIKIIENSALVRYLCAGYLSYIAMGMIFDDELAERFLLFINFPYPALLATLIGLFTVVLSWHMDENYKGRFDEG